VTLDDILRDIHALEKDLLVFERKYGVLSDTFYQAYQRGEEPSNPSWVLDWSEWGATCELVRERRGRSVLSDAALQRVWDNEADAAYDNWRALYDVPAR
jgi:hypothetical protein